MYQHCYSITSDNVATQRVQSRVKSIARAAHIARKKPRQKRPDQIVVCAKGSSVFGQVTSGSEIDTFA